MRIIEIEKCYECPYHMHDYQLHLENHYCDHIDQAYKNGAGRKIPSKFIKKNEFPNWCSLKENKENI